MSLHTGFHQLLQQCVEVFVQFFEPLDINTIIEGIRIAQNSEYAVTKIQKAMQSTLVLEDLMSPKSIEQRFKTIVDENNNTDFQAYFRYFRAIDAKHISQHKYKQLKEQKGRLIECILRNECMIQNETDIKNRKPISSGYKVSKYLNEKLLNIQSNQVMSFKHQELIDWNDDLLHRRKPSKVPEYWQFNVKFGYLSSNFKNCVSFLLEKGKEVQYGNGKRVKEASFILSKLFLSNIFEHSDFIAVFNRIDQTGWYPMYPCRRFQMKFYWMSKTDQTFLVSLKV